LPNTPGLKPVDRKSPLGIAWFCLFIGFAWFCPVLRAVQLL
jgi:hypothetical protein